MNSCNLDYLAYNHYSTTRGACYKVLQHLILNNEDIWKILHYNTPDALSKPNLTIEEKGKLIFNGTGDSEDYRILRSPFLDDAIVEQQSQLRIYIATLSPINRSIGVVSIAFECVTHNKLINLNTYESRLEVMVQELLSTLNGSEVNSLGVLSFDMDRSQFDLSRVNIYNNRNFVGNTVIMSYNEGDIYNV